MSKGKVITKCKVCEKEYDRKESIRVFGVLPDDQNCCSARCYTSQVVQLYKEQMNGEV